MLIIHPESCDTIQNIYRLEINNVKCDLIFGPVKIPGKYYFYYLPYEVQEEDGYYYKNYYNPEPKPDPDWIETNNLIKSGFISSLPYAICNEIQSRTNFDSFYPMEVIATREEKEDLLSNNKGEYFLFPEKRDNPIRMFDNIPYKWTKQKPNQSFKDKAFKNEYYVFQICIWAAQKELEDVKIQFTGLETVLFPSLQNF